MNLQPLKRPLILISFTLLLLWFFWNFNLFLSALSAVWNILTPFLLGLAMAFLLNILMVMLEKPLSRRLPKLARPLALVFALISITAIVLVLLLLIVPQISMSFLLVAEQLPQYAETFVAWASNLADHLNLDLSQLEQYALDWNAISTSAVNFLKTYGTNFLNSTMHLTTSIVTAMVNFFLGLVFAIYILLQKETLARQSTRLLQAIIPAKLANHFLSQCKVAANIFRQFVTGQLTEAVIIGVLCFLGMTICRFPYAAMISALVGFTALIPIVGALIGTVVGAFLILMISPIQAFWFVVFLLVLQQLEGNLIYPRVVGKSVGLPGLWVLFAITVGGNLGGVLGMLLAVPVCSFIYGSLRDFVSYRLDKPEPEPELPPQ